MKSLREIYEFQVRKDYRATDKGRGARSHLELYQTLFDSYRQTATKLFEIGVRHGGSIRMWENYFPNATIYGLDIQEKAIRRLSGERIKGFQVDQSQTDQLEFFGKEQGPFDIGIDDGSHVWSHQILSFESLWPFIKPGGLYVVEDVLTSYDIWLDNSKSAQRIDYAQGGQSCIEYFKDLVDHINFYGEDWDSIETEEYTDLQRTVDWIAFRANSIFVKKRDDA
ncbi:MAG: class I SAM-dependent methyltransferase [Candidatus Thorarchaeota archaeon]|jgi:cephalosporin hydroxylase